MNTFDSLNRTADHPVDVHFQTVLFDVITIAFGWFISIYKLPSTIDTYMILTTSFFAVITDVS